MIAMLTNNFVPLQRTFSHYDFHYLHVFVGSIATGFTGSLLSTLMLTGVIILGVMLTFAMSKLLSKTVLKVYLLPLHWNYLHTEGHRLEKAIVRSLLDRTIFVWEEQ